MAKSLFELQIPVVLTEEVKRSGPPCTRALPNVLASAESEPP